MMYKLGYALGYIWFWVAPFAAIYIGFRLAHWLVPV